MFIIYSEQFVYLTDKFNSALVCECFVLNVEQKQISEHSAVHWKPLPVLREK